MRNILQTFLEGDGFPNELVIDAHTHIGRGFDGSQHIENAAQRALTRMDAVGIDASCVMGSQYLIEGDYREGNNDLLWLHQHYPDRFVCFTNINPHDKLENVLIELQRMYDIGIRGIKLINAYQNYPSEGAVLWALYEFAAEHKLIVLNHSWGSGETIDRIASTFPDMTMIIGHHTDSADDLLKKFPNLFLIYPAVPNKLSSLLDQGCKVWQKGDVITLENDYLCVGNPGREWHNPIGQKQNR